MLYINPMPSSSGGRPDLLVTAESLLVPAGRRPRFRSSTYLPPSTVQEEVWATWLRLLDEVRPEAITTDEVSRGQCRTVWRGHSGDFSLEAEYSRRNGQLVLGDATASTILADGTRLSFKGRGFSLRLAARLGVVAQAAVEAA